MGSVQAFIIGFLVGLFVGAIFGVIGVSILTVGKKADEMIDKLKRNG
ncbi:MAG: DUF3789 domain-containing protein [Candidatus Aenigmatarchaeota archaeon]